MSSQSLQFPTGIGRAARPASEAANQPPSGPAAPEVGVEAVTDTELVARLQRGETGAFEPLMRRHNQLLFRLARSILRDDAEAEDAVQQAYLSAYVHVHQFSGRSKVSTWLTRIVINEGLSRRRKRERRSEMTQPDSDSPWLAGGQAIGSPEEAATGAELRRLLESALDTLPTFQRLVFVLRQVEGRSTEEAASCLGTTQGNVRIALHRGRAELRAALSRRLDAAAPEVFAFAGERCDRIVARVLAGLEGAPVS